MNEGQCGKALPPIGRNFIQLFYDLENGYHTRMKLDDTLFLT